MRPYTFLTGDYYHIYNRGVDKRDIFLDQYDYLRFMKSLYTINNKVHKPGNSISKYSSKLLLKNDLFASVHCFCLMPNHYHLLVEQVNDNGITKLMNRLGNSYTKYFNEKYKRKGRLFSSSFQSVSVKSTEQLIHLSRYIHNNPKKINERISSYTWSSLRAYLNDKIYPFISTNKIMSHFISKDDYLQYITTNV